MPETSVEARFELEPVELFGLSAQRHEGLHAMSLDHFFSSTGLTAARASLAMDTAIRAAAAVNARAGATVLDHNGEVRCFNRTDGTSAALFNGTADYGQSLLQAGTRSTTRARRLKSARPKKSMLQ